MEKRNFVLRSVNIIIFLVGVTAFLLFPTKQIVTAGLVAAAHNDVVDATEKLEKAQESKYPSFQKKENVISSYEESLNKALEVRKNYNHSSEWWISAPFARASAFVKAMRLVASSVILLFVFLVLRSNIRRNRRRRAWKEQKRLQRFRAERAAKNAVREAEEDAVYQELLSCITK